MICDPRIKWAAYHDDTIDKTVWHPLTPSKLSESANRLFGHVFRDAPIEDGANVARWDLYADAKSRLPSDITRDWIHV